MYLEFAYIYDTLMKNVDYEKWTDQIEAIFKKYGKAPKTVADLACGTGGITNTLAARGYRATGIDLSEDMLYVAREKARKSGLRIPYICQNIVQLELHKPVDAIVCMCDGLNYILDKADLKKALERIYHFLNPGGILVFDISSHYKLSSVLGNHTMADTGEDISLIWLNQFNKETQILEMNLTFFTKDGSRYKRTDETHLQRAYQEDEILALLTECNFTDTESFSPDRLTSPKKRSQRIFFAAIRQ
jgi:2-polyprenyl-3-methyl-5-hydroxy-6-metoxy-1,4-benzoquinol methylase